MKDILSRTKTLLMLFIPLIIGADACKFENEIQLDFFEVRVRAQIDKECLRENYYTEEQIRESEASYLRNREISTSGYRWAPYIPTRLGLSLNNGSNTKIYNYEEAFYVDTHLPNTNTLDIHFDPTREYYGVRQRVKIPDGEEIPTISVEQIVNGDLTLVGHGRAFGGERCKARLDSVEWNGLRYQVYGDDYISEMATDSMFPTAYITLLCAKDLVECPKFHSYNQNVFATLLNMDEQEASI